MDILHLGFDGRTYSINHIDKYHQGKKQRYQKRTFDTLEEAFIFVENSKRMSTTYKDVSIMGYEFSECNHYVTIYYEVNTYDT